MDILLVVGGFISIIGGAVFYIYLVDRNKIEPHTPRPVERDQVYRGNFWDAETKQYYKWDELMKLKNKKEKEKDDT